MKDAATTRKALTLTEECSTDRSGKMVSNEVLGPCVYGGDEYDNIFSSLWEAPPSVAVVGVQSSRKSSVLESIVGNDFLPRGSALCLVLQVLPCASVLTLKVIDRPFSHWILELEGPAPLWVWPWISCGKFFKQRRLGRSLTIFEDMVHSRFIVLLVK
ncbi:hypothetical protein Nepgr_018048 [Nepenthes gracilis]|uniref:Dynamin N-terminal domain-containing protein n=1 Tax=Nepenthes gracilis TaxID=150966 RepID=A0AAD3SSB0_NEPGR|nr:hypothetical protein Nepgr_018048 [Nepenthes gracilis]